MHQGKKIHYDGSPGAIVIMHHVQGKKVHYDGITGVIVIMHHVSEKKKLHYDVSPGVIVIMHQGKKVHYDVSSGAIVIMHHARDLYLRRTGIEPRWIFLDCRFALRRFVISIFLRVSMAGAITARILESSFIYRYTPPKKVKEFPIFVILGTVCL